MLTLKSKDEHFTFSVQDFASPVKQVLLGGGGGVGVGGWGGWGGGVVTHLPPTSEVGSSNPGANFTKGLKSRFRLKFKTLVLNFVNRMLLSP